MFNEKSNMEVNKLIFNQQKISKSPKRSFQQDIFFKEYRHTLWISYIIALFALPISLAITISPEVPASFIIVVTVSVSSSTSFFLPLPVPFSAAASAPLPLVSISISFPTSAALPVTVVPSSVSAFLPIISVNYACIHHAMVIKQLQTYSLVSTWVTGNETYSSISTGNT